MRPDVLSLSLPRLSADARELDRLRADPRHVGLFLDFDGTLAPIARDPDAATLEDETRHALGVLAGRFGAVAVVSGRSLDDLAPRVGVGGVWLAGSHGAAIQAPGGERTLAPIAPDLAERLSEVAARAQPLPPAVRVETKPASVAFHYRGVEGDTALVAALTARVTAAATAAGLSVGPGRCLVEVRVPGIDKGGALRTIAEATGVTAPMVLGDDWTDLDAFRAARALAPTRAFNVAVWSAELPPALLDEADAWAEDVAAVHAWLMALAQ
jgi:trehalose-phosphatase